jgi:NADH:ubiquinone oxidoreductase subunit C
MFFLKKHSYSRFDSLVDICGVDFLEKKNRLEVVYSLLSISYNTRLAVTVQVHEKDELDSVTSIYKSAGWLEREV